MKEIDIPRAYLPILEPRRYKVLSGGRGSGKSFIVALYLLIRATRENIRILCTREIQNSISDSVHKILCDLIEEYEFPNFEITQNSIRNLASKSEFIFKGLRHNVMEIKSMQGVNISWQEEAQTLSKESIDILVPTIREENSELIFTFNRVTQEDAVWKMFCENPTDDTWYLHTTFEDNPFFPNVLEAERLKCLNNSPADYAHIWLGEPKVVGGNIYDTDWFLWTDKIPEEKEFDYRFITADTAYKDVELTKKDKATDPDFQAFGYWGVKNKKCYLIDVEYKQLKALEVENWIVPWIAPKISWGFRYVWIEDKGHGIYLNQRFPAIRIPVPPAEKLKEWMQTRRLGKVERANNSVARIDRINKNVIINTGMGETKIKRIKEQLTFFPNLSHDDVEDIICDGIQIALDKKDYVAEYKQMLGRS
jgi:phage terminase large subunit-like protein